MKDRFGLDESEPRCNVGNGREPGNGTRVCGRLKGHSGPHQSILDDSAWNDEGKALVSDGGLSNIKNSTIALLPMVRSSPTGEGDFTLTFYNIPNKTVRQIVATVLPGVLELWMRKAKDYGDASGGLGPRAPFVDIWRKVKKLRRGLWDGEELQFEKPPELLSDLIGTSLNILFELRENDGS